MTLRELDDRTERTMALRALLAEPFLDRRAPAYALVRRHEREIARELQTTFGYQLQVGSTAARASGPPTAAGHHRPIRVPPASATGRRLPPDEWPALSDRAGLLLLLTLAALERSGAQTAIAELARDVERAAADVDPPVSVDFNRRGERVAFADGLDLLCHWGVLEHASGSHDSYTRREQGDDEALFTIDHRRLALLLEDPAAALAATHLAQLREASGRYAPTPEGENRARFEALTRRLAEDPVLLLGDLGPEEQAYFLGQRARIEEAVAHTTGYVVERRQEGSALICDDRAFTDLPFPTNATVKQVALLLCDRLSTCGPDGELSPEALRDAVGALIREHGEHWGRDTRDVTQVTALADAAIEVLLACDLLRRSAGGTLVPIPLAARFRSPTLRSGGVAR
ncbi:TIGR02678 family protein [Conexibacter sp. DBS9H8]|uniref:TIGR02678 family protein n=1 Tax=Conexibacter sp. DBS9H8 TaxID=2937801 RepID=UPI0020102A45|nr:TIGR02678 family protein [Conexibacter sp. DBS9H8]